MRSAASMRALEERYVCIDAITLLVTALVALATMLVTSDMVGVGSGLHEYLLSRPHVLWFVAPVTALVACMLLFVYVADMAYWISCLNLRAVYLLCLGFVIFADLILLTAQLPVAPILGGVFVTIVAWRTEKSLLSFTGAEGLLTTYLRAVRRSSLVVAAVLVVWWLAWITLEPLGFHEILGSPHATSRFASPLLLAFDYAIIAVCVEIRAKFEEGRAEGYRGPVPLANYCHAYLIFVIVALLLMHASIALPTYGHHYSTTAIWFSVVSALSIFVYLGFMIGSSRILDMAKTDDFASTLLDFLYGDITKACLVLVCLPLSPVIFAIDALHEAARKCLGRCGVVKEDPEHRSCLTREMKSFLDLDLTSILSMAMYLSLAIVVARLSPVIIAPGMALLRLRLEDQGWPVVVLGSFTVAVILFLLPPVSGFMIYIPISMMIISKWGYDSYTQLAIAISIATVYCLALKLVGSALQQKAIGEPLSTSITVKKFCQLQLPMYRVARYILNQKGVTLQKVAVLTGMPDWVISVLCGILGLELCPIMLCTLPEVVKILPACVAVGFLLKSSSDGVSEDLASRFDVVATVCMGLTMVIPGVLSVLVTFIVKRLMAEFKDEFDNEDSTWWRDPQEKEILAAIKEDEERKTAEKAVTHWDVQPCCVRALLLVGTLLGSLATYTNLFEPFAEFDFKDPDAIDELPGGSILGLVKAYGWAMLALAGGVCVCVAAYQMIRYCQVVRAASNAEREELLSLPSSDSLASSSSSSSDRGAWCGGT